MESQFESLQFTVYGLQFTVYSLRFTVYSLRFTVYSLQFTVYSLQFTAYGLVYRWEFLFKHRETETQRFLRLKIKNERWKIRILELKDEINSVSLCLCVQINKNMKELFLKVWHCVPLPAAAKPLAVSELPPAACQQQGLSSRIGKLSKSKNIFLPSILQTRQDCFSCFCLPRV